MKILLLGAPGSGKGTLSEYLVDKYNFIHISTGNIFRDTITNNLENASELKEYISKGLLVPDRLTNKVVENYLKKIKDVGCLNIVFDGYPRSIEQAKFLESFFIFDKVIYLSINDEILMKRLTGRRICGKCKKIYNVYFSPPKKENECDYDHSVLTQRKDDIEEVINERLHTYKKLTFPLVEYYKKQVIEIDNHNNNDYYKIIDNLVQ